MPTPPTGLFCLSSVKQLGLAVLRATFTNPPKAVDASDSDDALNPANYELTGPSSNTILRIETVEDDASSVDLFMAVPMALGSWQLTASNIVDN
jgi:hypothetical protein